MTDSDEPRFLGRPVNPPVERASTLLVPRAEDLYRTDGVIYGLFGMRVHHALRAAFRELYRAADCHLTPSGLSAVTTAIMSVCSPGDHLLVTDAAYGPTRAFCSRIGERFAIETQYYDPAAASDIAALLRPNTRAVLMEAPGSLTFEMQDIPAIVEACRAAGVTTIIDDTWSAGVFMRPMALGVDIAAHAATKYPSGGSDILMGAVISRTQEVAKLIEAYTHYSGMGVSPDDAYVVLRGLQSMEVRLKRHEETALVLARWLEARPEVARVLHPALESHPGHALWRRDFSGSCGLFGVVFKTAHETRVNAFLNGLQVFGLGFSFGGFESLAIWSDPQVKRTAVPWRAEGALMRFHAGLEPAEELIADLERGFEAMGA